MNKSILIVEDNELNLKLLNDILQIQGYRTILVNNGRGVVEKLYQKLVDLVLMDVQLPGSSGLDVVKVIKADEQLKSIPIIAVTAFAMKGDKHKFLTGGYDGYVSKPIEVPVLMEEIAKFLA